MQANILFNHVELCRGQHTWYRPLCIHFVVVLNLREKDFRPNGVGKKTDMHGLYSVIFESRERNGNFECSCHFFLLPRPLTYNAVQRA